ncbi:hypothetical protein Lal_00028503 [Lupinus albus]|nr:hypothetical protein Lal_00028503 [Lupinus albus]
MRKSFHAVGSSSNTHIISTIFVDLTTGLFKPKRISIQNGWPLPCRDKIECSQRGNLYKTLSSEDDWAMANEICQKLKLFYNVTLVFSLTLYPIVNALFQKNVKLNWH